MEPQKKSHGALIGSIIIVVILIVGGIYAWQQKAKTEEAKKIQEAQNTTEQIDQVSEEIENLDTNVDIDLNSIE
jgi:uncharacterized protein HemX